MTPRPPEIQLDLLPEAPPTAMPEGPPAGPECGTTARDKRAIHPRLRNLLWGLPQWALVFWIFQRDVHWIHALCVTALMAWVRFLAVPLAVRIRGPLREKPPVHATGSPARSFFGWFWKMDACQNTSERLWIAGLGVLPVAALHWGFLHNASLELGELACFGYLYNAMVLCLPHDSPEVESGRASLCLLGISAAWGSRLDLRSFVLPTVFMYLSILLIPLSALLWVRLTLEAAVHQERIVKAAILLALYLWTGTILVTAFGMACEQRQTLYRMLFQTQR